MTIKYYLVGGALRDMQMGIIPKDHDFVVVGASPEDFDHLQCVGNDFPVYLEPTHGWELALARIERKVGVGYKGFESDWKGVTLKQDLMRRDLTINSLAREVDFDMTVKYGHPVFIGDVIDYFGGIEDLNDKVLHPVSESFCEDPVRLLRVGRFLARYKGFTISDQLEDLCYKLQDNGELNNLVPERVWLETEKALSERYPSKYFGFISSFDFPFTKFLRDMEDTVENNKWHQENNVLVHTFMVLDYASQKWNDPEINWACVTHDVAKPKCYRERNNGHGHDYEGVKMIEDFCKEWKIPNNYRDLAKITCEQHQKIHGVLGRGGNKMSKAKSIMKLFEQTSALSKPERFRKMLKVCEADAAGRIGIAAKEEYSQRPYLEECLQAVLDFKTKDLSKQLLSEGKSGIVIGQKIREERIRVIRQVQNRWKEKLNNE